MRATWIVVLISGLASVAVAQTEDVLRSFVVNQQTVGFVSGQLVSGPPVKGAPYSAEAVNETIQVLADGNRIVQRTSAKQYRDADGRERREETSAMGIIFISDPVAGTRYTLNPEDLSAEKGPMPAFNTRSVAGVAGVAAGRGGPETFTVAIAGPGPGNPGGTVEDFMYVNAGAIAKFTNPSEIKTEQLGTNSIEGIQAQGTRTTITIPAGDIGNDRPIHVVDEQWYSPDLQMTVMTKHSDPRMGETTFALKNINRASPPLYLFEVPAGYTVKTGPQGRALRVERRE